METEQRIFDPRAGLWLLIGANVIAFRPHTFWLELALIGLSPAEYELEIGLGSEQVLVTVLLPKDSTADPAGISDCLEQDPMIQTNVIKEEAE